MLAWLVLIFLFLARLVCGQEVGIGFSITRSVTLYNYTLVNPGPGWEQVGFDDSQWTPDSRSPLGYETSAGEGPPGGYGTNIPDTTTEMWLRTTFPALTTSSFLSLTSAIVRVSSDNSADVYINGQMVIDEASRNVNHDFEYWNSEQTIGAGLLAAVGGSGIGAADFPHNVVAVRVINPFGGGNRPSTDIFMDMELELFASTNCQQGQVADECGVCNGDGSTCTADFEPRQIALHMTKVETQMRISWITELRPTASVVQWGLAPDALLSEKVEDSSTRFTFQNRFTSWWIHSVLLTDLEPGQRYYYRVGGPQSTRPGAPVPFSAPSFFDLQSNDHHAPGVPQHPFCVAFLADGGVNGDAGRVYRRLARAVAEREVDLVLFPGDLCYNDGRTDASPNNAWDIWGRMRTASAVGDEEGAQNGDTNLHRTIVARDGGSRIPWMFATGNHEDSSGARERFEFYRPLIPQPEEGGPDGLWFSFDFERMHVISISSEHAYGAGSPQLLWLEQDLIYASSPQNRSAHPWIVAMAHRPPFNSNSNYRSFVNLRDAVSPLFDQYGVDMAFFGHEHSYERTFPINAQGQPLLAQVDASQTGSSSFPYRGAGIHEGGSRGTVYGVVGTAGRGLRVNFDFPVPEWSASRTSAHHGYARVCFDDGNGAHWEFVGTHDGGLAEPTDQMYLCRQDQCTGALPRVSRPLPLLTWFWTDSDPALLTPADPEAWRRPEYQPQPPNWRHFTIDPTSIPPSSADSILLARAVADAPEAPTVPGSGPLWLRANFTLPLSYVIMDEGAPNGQRKRQSSEEQFIHPLSLPASFELQVASYTGADIFINNNQIDDEASRNILNRPTNDPQEWHRRPRVNSQFLQAGTNLLSFRLDGAGNNAPEGTRVLKTSLMAQLRFDSAAAEALRTCGESEIVPETGLCFVPPTPAPTVVPGQSSPSFGPGASGGNPGSSRDRFGSGGLTAFDDSQPPVIGQPGPSSSSSSSSYSPSDPTSLISSGIFSGLDFTTAFFVVVPILICCIFLLLCLVGFLCVSRRRDGHDRGHAVLEVWRQDVGRIREEEMMRSGGGSHGADSESSAADGKRGRKSPRTGHRSRDVAKRSSKSVPMAALNSNGASSSNGDGANAGISTAYLQKPASEAHTGGRRSRGRGSRRVSAQVGGSGNATGEERKHTRRADGRASIIKGSFRNEEGSDAERSLSPTGKKPSRSPSPGLASKKIREDSAKSKKKTELKAPKAVIASTSLGDDGSSASASSESDEVSSTPPPPKQ